MANGYYTHTTYPGTNSSGSSAAMRAELDAIMAGFTLLPTPLGSGQQGFTGGNWTNPVISGGSIDGASVGATSRSTGRFTTLDANGAVNFSSTTALGGGGSMAGTFSGAPTFSGAVVLSGGPVITGGTINNAAIGGTTRAAGAFTTLAANAAVTFSSGGALTGTFTGGTHSGALIENTPIGSTTRAAGAFTTLAANAAVTFSAGGALTGTFSGTPTFSGAVVLSGGPVITGGSINNTPIGGTTRNSGRFTTVDASSTVAFADASTQSTASARILLATATASNSASVDFTGFVTAEYAHYEVEYDGVNPVSGSSILLLARVSVAGVFQGGTSYAFAYQTINSAIATSTNGLANGSSINIGGVLDTGAGLGASGTFTLFNPASTTQPKRMAFTGSYNNSSALVAVTGAAAYLTSGSAVDGLRFLLSAGNISTGVFKLYGIRA